MKLCDLHFRAVDASVSSGLSKYVSGYFSRFSGPSPENRLLVHVVNLFEVSSLVRSLYMAMYMYMYQVLLSILFTAS